MPYSQFVKQPGTGRCWTSFLYSSTRHQPKLQEPDTRWCPIIPVDIWRAGTNTCRVPRRFDMSPLLRSPLTLCNARRLSDVWCLSENRNDESSKNHSRIVHTAMMPDELQLAVCASSFCSSTVLIMDYLRVVMLSKRQAFCARDVTEMIRVLVFDLHSFRAKYKIQ